MAPAPGRAWTPPSTTTAAATPAAAPPSAPVQLPPDIADRVQHLTLDDVVDIALRNNPVTQASWATARAAADLYQAEKGAYYPTVDAQVNATRIKTTSTQGRSAVLQTTYQPSVSLSWLLFDFGGRGSSVSVARNALLAADFTHNAVLQSVVLQVETAYFNYLATRALREAQLASVRDAQANLAAAEERRQVGVATIADVLQARTALSQAQLALETVEGDLQTTRGALAVSMGLPANVPYDIDVTAAPPPVSIVADSVDAVIAAAVANRPDLAAARAQAQEAAARVGVARAERLPALELTGNGGRTYLSRRGSAGNNYTFTLGVRIPLFAGLSRMWTQRAESDLAAAAQADAATLQQQVIFQVFSSYYALQTAVRRVHTADDLLASAQQNEEVASGRYRAGVGSILDLLNAQSALADARAQQVQARWVWQTALAQLAHDAGVLGERGEMPFRMVPDTIPERPPR
ncbi:MAG TPA: TolC family protein [Gemmatimonadaceae bacterium]|nr:TolC family protein [Gemmatimonadaceae bacterium]